MNPTSTHEDSGSIPGLVHWVKDLVFLWLWRRPAAIAPVWPLTWEPPYAVGAALNKRKRKRKKKLRKLWEFKNKLMKEGKRKLKRQKVVLETELFFWSFCLFYGRTHGLWRFPGLGCNQNCCWPTPQPQQHRIQAESATYTTARGNAGSLTHWARPQDRTPNLMVPSQVR